jgi:hypothetical protein
MQEESYRKHAGISQSQIKKFRFISPLQWKSLYIDNNKDEEIDSPSFLWGEVLDCVLMSPETIEDKFLIENIILPSTAIASITKSVYDHILYTNLQLTEISQQLPEPPVYLEIALEAHKEVILNYCNSYQEKPEDVVGWQGNWKADTKIDKIIEKGSKYFELLKKSNGRKIITSEMNALALQMKDILVSDQRVKGYFVQQEDEGLLHQLEIFSEYEEIPIKGALDIVRINHKDKTIQEADFKTSFSAFNFLESIKKYDYCGQHSYYDFLLRDWIKTYQKGKYKDYTILPPINIVIDTRDRQPYIYQFNWDDINISKVGNINYLPYAMQTYLVGKIKKGWQEILDDICWHIKTQNWNYTREQYEQGYIAVNLLNS